jgi:prepilin-type N-terminal cleavage/methylation domain-containing protein
VLRCLYTATARMVSPTPAPDRLQQSPETSGFSMVELLAVMAVMAIVAATGGVLFFSGPAPGIRMQAGVAEAGALFNQARALAQARGSTARVLVSRDPEDAEKYLRYMLVVVRVPGETAEEPTTWQPVGNGVYLPQGIFHVPASAASLLWNPVSREDDEKAGSPWASYVFSASGHGGGRPFLLMAGVKAPDRKVKIPEGANVDGFLVRRNGYLTYFENADQVKQFLEQLEK